MSPGGRNDFSHAICVVVLLINRSRYSVVPYSKCNVCRALSWPCAIVPWCSKDFLLRHRASHHFYDVFTKLTGWAALFAWLLLLDDLNPKFNFPETGVGLVSWSICFCCVLFLGELEQTIQSHQDDSMFIRVTR